MHVNLSMHDLNIDQIIAFSQLKIQSLNFISQAKKRKKEKKKDVSQQV